jgi:hypothetical protein
MYPLAREALSSSKTMYVLGTEVLRIVVVVVVANQHTGTSILFSWKTRQLEREKTTHISHPNLLPLLSNGIQLVFL